MLRKCLLASALALVANLQPQRVSANSLLDATDQICADVKAFVDKEGKNKVRVGPFFGKGPEAERASASPLLREMLRVGLQKKKLEVVETGAHYEATGSFRVIEDAMTARVAVVLRIILDDLKGNERVFTGIASGKAEKYFFENIPDVVTVLGLSIYFPPEKSEKERIAHLKSCVDQPQCHFDHARVLAGKDAPFAIEILVGSQTGQPREISDYQVKQPLDKAGLAFVPIGRKDAFAVRLHNRSKFDCAVDLRLNGLNMYYFSEQRDRRNGPAYRYVTIPANRVVEIRGWHVMDQDFEPFVIEPRANAAMARAHSHNLAEIGTITANFYRAWDRKAGRPDDEPPNPADYSMCPDTAGRGQRFEERFVEVDYAVGTFRGSVSVRHAK